MKHILLICITFIFHLVTNAQIPDGYYLNASNKRGYDLKTVLHQIIKNHSAQTYAELWTHFKLTDNKGNNVVWDMYSDIPNGTPLYVYYFTVDQCGYYSVEGDCYNREHSWPKSWFNDAAPMYTDLFHLYPTDGKVNGLRSNYPFAEVGAATLTTSNGSKLGYSKTTGYSGTVFEPIDEYKGDFARTYFYMATRYENVIASWEKYDSNGDAVLNGTSNQVFENWYLNLLLKWHSQDPVSQKEINRNNAVFQIQQNRNPFIDHPEYVSLIWDTSTATDVTKYKQQLQITVDNRLKTITISHIENRCLTRVDVVNSQGSAVATVLINSHESQLSLNAAAYQPGFYLIVAKDKDGNTYINKLIL